MAQIVKLRRSSVSGQKPTNSNLQLGELALNTTDGKVYMAKSGSLGPSVEELISTNTVNTGSVSISGSFNLKGNQSITGSLLVGTGSFHVNNPEILHVQNSGSYNIAHFQANNEYYAQLNVKNTNSGSTASGDIVITADNGTENVHYVDLGINSSTYDDGYVGYANDAYLINAGKDLYVGTLGGPIHPSNLNLFAQSSWENPQIQISGSKQISFNTGSVSSGYTYEFSGSIKADHNLNVVGHISASEFTGSFKGDGSQLYNIPYSGVTGLELNKITSGSVSASISPDRGLEINTDTTITGSLTISGSNTLVQVLGDIQTDGFIRFDPVSKNIDTSISASYLFVSSSTNDLYFSQNGNGYSNVTRLRWLEGNMYSGLLHGGAITASGTTFNISKGSGIIVDLNASLIDDPYPTTKFVQWDTFTGQTLTNRTTSIQTFLAIDDSGQIVQSTSPFVATQYNTLITLGTVLHQNQSTVNGAISYPNVAYGYKQRTYDFLKAFGPLRLSGLNIVTSGSLGLNVGAGTAFSEGRNYQVDPNNPSYITDSGTAVSKIFRYYQVSGTTFVQDTNGGNGYAAIDPTKYVLNGVLTNVGGDYSIQRVFWYPNSVTKGIVVYYGNATYGTIREAIDNLNIETFNEVENTKQNAVYLGSIIIAGNGNFTQSNKFSIVPGGLFRSIGGSGGGGNIPTSRLFDLSDVNVTTEQDGDLLVYNVDTLKWESKKSLEGNYTITGSLNVTGGLTGSFTGSFIGDGTGLYNIPASGVTGLQLDKIVSGNASASIDNNGFYVNKNVYIDGTITAKELYIDYVTSSVLYQSGSTKFGDSADDNHNFTGSVYIDGNLNVDSITGSIDFNNLTNVPTLVSGSSQISYTGITNIPNGIVSGSGQVIDLGFTTTSSFEGFTSSYTTDSSSFDTRINTITGSFNSYTSSTDTHLTSLDNFTSSVVLTNQTSSMTVLSASYALTAAFALNAGAGGSGGSGGGFAELNQTTPSTSWTFQHNLGQKFPIFQIFDSNDEVIIPSQIIAVSSDSATITFPSAQTGRAIASLGTGPGGMTQQFSAATTWSLSHNMGADYPIVTVYNNNRKIIFPDEIRSIDADNVEVYFSAPVAGYLNVAKGGHIISGSIDVSNINLTGSNVISGSSQISNLGYATTGSNIFNGSQTINGCLTINNAKICATGTTISANTQIFNLSSFDGAFFDYVVKSGVNMRAGTIMSAWNGSNATYNETTTVDLGNTSAVGFNVSATGALNATISSGTWTVEVLYRALGDSIPTPDPTPTPGPTSTPTATPGPTATLGPTATPAPTATSNPNKFFTLYKKTQTVATNPLIDRYNIWGRANNSGQWTIISSPTNASTIYSIGGYLNGLTGTTIAFALTKYDGPSEMPIEFGAGNNGPYTGYCGFDNPYIYTIQNVGDQGVYINVRMSGGTYVECISVQPTATPTPTTSPTPTPTLTPTPTPGSTNYLISSGFTISEPCNGLFGNSQTVYGDDSDWLQVTRFYTNSGMTTPFNGNSLYYGDSNATNGTTLQINSSGYVINSYAC